MCAVHLYQASACLFNVIKDTCTLNQEIRTKNDQSKKGSKDQESIQSSTTSDSGYTNSLYFCF